MMMASACPATQRVLDSGSDKHLRGALDRDATTFNREPIALRTAKSVATTDKCVEVELGKQLGPAAAYHVPGSVHVDSIGKIIKQQTSSVLWDNHEFDGPLLFENNKRSRSLLRCALKPSSASAPRSRCKVMLK